MTTKNLVVKCWRNSSIEQVVCFAFEVDYSLEHKGSQNGRCMKSYIVRRIGRILRRCFSVVAVWRYDRFWKKGAAN